MAEKVNKLYIRASLLQWQRHFLLQGNCGACRRKWWLTDTDPCPSGETQTMSHIVESCRLTKLNGGLSQLHSVDEDAVSWLTSYGSWHAYEKKKRREIQQMLMSNSHWFLQCCCCCCCRRCLDERSMCQFHFTFLNKSNVFCGGDSRGSSFLTHCRVLSLSDCRYSLNPLSQTQIDWVGRYRIR